VSAIRGLSDAPQFPNGIGLLFSAPGRQAIAASVGFQPPQQTLEKISGRSTRSSDAARLPIRNYSRGENRLKNRFNFIVSNGDFA
jgi:hypothetical protein